MDLSEVLIKLSNIIDAHHYMSSDIGVSLIYMKGKGHECVIFSATNGESKELKFTESEKYAHNLNINKIERFLKNEITFDQLFN